KYLCRYDLDIKLFEALGLDIFDLRPNRNVFLLDTKQGKKILKMINYDDDRLNFIIHSTEYLRERYDSILKINKLPNGEWKFKWKGNDYILLDYFEGTEFNIANPIELELITEAVAKLHNAGRGIQEATSKEMNEKNSELFKLKDYFINSKKDLEKLKEIVGSYKYKNEFDEIFIKEVDYHLSDVKVCIDLLEKSKYEDLCRDKEKITLCHNDLAYHNILFNQNKVSFIDFDYCNINLRVIDLCNFIIKSIKKFGFSLEMYDSIIEMYDKLNNLSKEEKELMYIYLRFPH
ncbi:CotS family spore coat protein, partial [Clostridium perfringens]